MTPRGGIDDNKKDKKKEKSTFPRLGIFLADTLAEPGTAHAAGALGFMEQGIQDERHLANELKTNKPILAIIGNPPYRRLEEGENRTLVGDWMDKEIWDDLKEPVRNAGWGNQLNTFPELSVAFWRWSLWKIFEAPNAPKRGVVAFITNRKFLTGKPYAGLRQMMRRRFDRVEIIDLRGDSRRGERAGVEDDQNVFNIQVGVCITLAIADGSKEAGTEASVYYRDAWEAKTFRRKEKLGWLSSSVIKGDVEQWVHVDRKGLADFRPKPFENGEWVGLNECFNFKKSGMKSGDDDVIVSVRRQALVNQVLHVLAPRDDPTHHTALERPFVYRPFDLRWFYNDLPLLDRPGPEMQRVFGASNLCLYAMPGGTGAGPAVWCHALLPDYHAFRGSYGGYAFPLYDRRGDAATHNLNPTLLAGLTAAYGKNVSAEQVFDAMLCLLSAKSYSLTFAEDLEDVFPHIPFPAAYKVFLEAAALGAEIRAVETFARPPQPAFMPPNFSTEPKGKIRTAVYADGSFEFCEGGAGKIVGISPDVWHYSVSSYDLLPKWIKGREGLDVDVTLAMELRDICGRIAEMIDLSAKADKILSKTLKNVMGRAAIGLAPAPND